MNSDNVKDMKNLGSFIKSLSQLVSYVFIHLDNQPYDIVSRQLVCFRKVYCVLFYLILCILIIQYVFMVLYNLFVQFMLL